MFSQFGQLLEEVSHTLQVNSVCKNMADSAFSDAIGNILAQVFKAIH